MSPNGELRGYLLFGTIFDRVDAVCRRVAPERYVSLHLFLLRLILSFFMAISFFVSIFSLSDWVSGSAIVHRLMHGSYTAGSIAKLAISGNSLDLGKARASVMLTEDELTGKPQELYNYGPHYDPVAAEEILASTWSL